MPSGGAECQYVYVALQMYPDEAVRLSYSHCALSRSECDAVSTQLSAEAMTMVGCEHVMQIIQLCKVRVCVCV